MCVFAHQVPRRNLLSVGCLHSALLMVSHGICVNTLGVQLRMLWSLSQRHSGQLSPTHKGENNQVLRITVSMLSYLAKAVNDAPAWGAWGRVVHCDHGAEPWEFVSLPERSWRLRQYLNRSGSGRLIILQRFLPPANIWLSQLFRPQCANSGETSPEVGRNIHGMCHQLSACAALVWTDLTGLALMGLMVIRWTLTHVTNSFVH